MKKIIPIILLLFSVCSFLSAQTPKVVFVVADWHKGDQMEYVVKKTKVKNGVEETVWSNLILQVVDSTEEYYRIKATYTGKEVSGYAMLADSLKKMVDDFLMDEDTVVTLYYRTDLTGTFLEIENTQEILEHGLLVAEKLLQGTGMDENTLQQAIQMMREMYTEDMVATKVFPEIALLHSRLGYMYSMKKPSKFVTSFNSPFGEVLGRGVTTVTAYDPKESFCRIETVSTMDQKQLKKAVKTLLDRVAAMTGNALPKKTFNSVKIDMSDVTIYECTLEPAIPTHVEYTRTVKVDAPDGSGDQMEQYVITRKKGDLLFD